MDREYAAFISYRHAALDSAVAKTVHSLMEQYRIPGNLRRDGRKKFGYVFRDQEELPVSGDLSEDIRRALDHAEHLIVICSPEMKKSPWVSREIEYFLQHHDRSKVYAVLAAGEPGEVFPQSLTQVVNADGTVMAVEPLAMDVRADSIRGMKKKLRREILRLYAAMLGCPYDELVLREQRRKRRQISTVAAVILAAVLGFTGMLLVKNKQIEEKNRDLAQQKRLLQLRESELLTRDAWDALKQGNRAGAVKSAVSALPITGEDRPYYPQAESALIAALGIFDQERKEYMLTDTELSMTAPVEDYVIREDGSAVAAVDCYSVVSCFDTESGRGLWSSQLSTQAVDHVQLLSCDPDRLIGICSEGVTALSYADGKTLWSYENASLAERSGVLSDDGRLLAVLDWRMTNDFKRYEFFLVVLATKNGQQICRVKLAEGMALNATEGMPYVEFGGAWGDFPDSCDSFGGCYFVRDAAGQNSIVYYRVDLNDESVETVEPRTLEEESCVPVKLYYSGWDCVSVLRQEASYTALAVERVIYADGSLKWRTATPVDSKLFGSSDPVLCCLNGDELYMTREDQIYVIDFLSGAPVLHRELDSPVLAMEILEERYFVFMTSDGSYTIGWRNDSGIYHSGEVFGLSLELGSGEKAALWGGGMLRLVEEGERYMNAVAASNGWAVILPEKEASCLSIRRVLRIKDLARYESVDILPEGTSLVGGGTELLGGHVVAFGPVRDSSDWEGEYSAVLYGGNTATVGLGSFWTMDDVMILPDASGYLSWSSDLTLHDGRGGSTVLTAQEQVALHETEDWIAGASRWVHRVRRMPSGEVLAASCDGQVLHLWRNGVFWQEISLPEDLRWAVASNVQYYRQLEISEKTVILSHFHDEKDCFMDAVAVYDLAAGSWERIPCTGAAMTEGDMALGAGGNAFALLDDKDMLHVYGINSGDTASFASPVPHNAVRQMEWILNDEYLLLKTEDQQTVIIEAATGETCFHQRIEGSVLGRIQVSVDQNNGRVYLWDSASADDKGLCVDMESWTVLAEIPGLVCYDGRQDKIFRYAGREEGLLCCHLPGTDEMVNYCREVFGEA